VLGDDLLDYRGRLFQGEPGRLCDFPDVPGIADPGRFLAAEGFLDNPGLQRGCRREPFTAECSLNPDTGGADCWADAFWGLADADHRLEPDHLAAGGGGLDTERGVGFKRELCYIHGGTDRAPGGTAGDPVSNKTHPDEFARGPAGVLLEPGNNPLCLISEPGCCHLGEGAGGPDGFPRQPLCTGRDHAEELDCKPRR